MTERIEQLLGQILAELQTINQRSNQAIHENEKQKASADQMLNNLMGIMPDQMKKAFKGGGDGQ